MKATCNGWSWSPCAKPSIVVISRPSTRAANERHDLTRLPSINTVHAPHWPRPQPFFEPLRCRCSRKASSSVVRGSSLSRSEEHTSELQSHHDLVCRLLLEK